MLKSILKAFGLGAAAGLGFVVVAAVADYDIPLPNGPTKTIFTFACFTTKLCPAHALIDSAGNELATPSRPLRTDPTGTTTQPVSVGSLPLPFGAAVESGGNLSQIAADLGAPGATACGSDTASCNVNQFLQRIAGRLSTIITTLGTPLQAGGSVTVAGASAVAPVPASQSAQASCQTLKNSPGGLLAVTATIGNTAGYLMLFDATSAPADGAVTTRWPAIPVNSNGTFGRVSMTFPSPLSFGTGIVVCFSTTGPLTKTAANAVISGQVQ